MVIQFNFIFLICGVVLLAIGIWTINDKSFVDELLRNSLYMNTTYVIIITSCFMIILSGFGCFAAFKEVKCLLLTHFLITLLLFVCLLFGGVLAYVFKEQVSTTMKAEMIADIRNYDPSNPKDPVTWAWDQTQIQLSCCGLMTEQVSQPWQMWRYNQQLNPTAEYKVVPTSCCMAEFDGDCLDFTNKTVVEDRLIQGDCLELTLNYVQGHASTVGAAAVASSAIMILGMISSLALFKSIV